MFSSLLAFRDDFPRFKKYFDMIESITDTEDPIKRLNAFSLMDRFRYLIALRTEDYKKYYKYYEVEAKLRHKLFGKDNLLFLYGLICNDTFSLGTCILFMEYFPEKTLSKNDLEHLYFNSATQNKEFINKLRSIELKLLQGTSDRREIFLKDQLLSVINSDSGVEIKNIPNPAEFTLLF
jgi:hypothetical protein